MLSRKLVNENVERIVIKKPKKPKNLDFFKAREKLYILLRFALYELISLVEPRGI